MKYFCQALNKFKLCQWHVLLESCQFKPLPGTQMPAFLQTSPLNLRADAPSLTPKSQHTPALLNAQSPFVEQEIFLAVPGVTWVFSTIHRETPARWWWWTNKIKHSADKKKAFPSLWKQQSLPAAGGGIIYLSEEHQGTDLSPFPGLCTAQKWWSAVPRVMLQARLSCSDSLLLQKEVICYHCSWHQIPHLPGALEPSLSGGERIWFTKPGKMYS